MPTTTDHRTGLSPACVTHCRNAEDAVRQLFFGADGTTLCAGLQAADGFALRCLNDAIAWHWHMQMWQQAKAGDVQATYASAIGWWKRIKTLVDAAETMKGAV